MRILIVDDHAMVREGLKRILLDGFKDASFGEAGNATEALEQIWKRAPSLAEQLAGEIQSPQGNSHETLSNREYQVMLLIAAGRVPKEIGSQLSLSAKTISTYRSRVLEKLKLKNNAEIMRYVVDRKLT